MPMLFLRVLVFSFQNDVYVDRENPVVKVAYLTYIFLKYTSALSVQSSCERILILLAIARSYGVCYTFNALSLYL